MHFKDFKLQEIISIVKEAGELSLLEYEKEDKKIKIKADNTPVSAGDLLIDRYLQEKLLKLYPDIHIISEETYEKHQNRENLHLSWLIDPIDGTKAFIAKDNGEYTINIALIKDKRPIFGIVYAPYSDELYYAFKNKGSYKIQNTKTTKLPDNSLKNIIFISKNHHSDKTKQFIENFENKYGKFNKIHMNSSLKLCKVAEGSECIYPKLGITWEWDIAASDIILNEANSILIDQVTKDPPLYNKINVQNNDFIAMDLKFYSK